MQNHQFKKIISLIICSFASVSALALDTQSIQWSGVIELEANYTDAYNDITQSDLVVATAWLGAEAQINDELAAVITFLYEEDDTPLEIDEAFLGQVVSHLTFTVGQIYLPFGQYRTSVVSDPLTLEIGETRESALLVEADYGVFQGSAYLFNGDADINNQDKLKNFGVRLALGSERDPLNWSVSVDHISNILDSDGIDTSAFALGKEVAGSSVAASISKANIGVNLEYLMTDEFEAADLAFGGSGAEVTVSHVDVFYSMPVAGTESVFGLSYNGTEEAVGLGLPENRLSVGVSMAVNSNATFNVEISQDDDYSVAEGGTGESASNILLQFAVEI